MRRIKEKQITTLNYVTGSTFNDTTKLLTLGLNGTTSVLDTSLASLASDIYVMSGVYDINTGVVTYTTNSGDTFDVSGFTSGMTDSYTNGATLSGNTIVFDNNIQGNNIYDVDLTSILTSSISGATDANTIAFSGVTNQALMYYDTSVSGWTVDQHVNAESTVIQAKVFSGATLTLGTPVYIKDIDNDELQVLATNALSSDTMPCVGIVAETMNTTEVKHVVTFGKIEGLDTSSWTIGDDLYVSTVTGELTPIRPTGNTTTQIQRIAKVLKVHASGGQLFVYNSSRTAGLPNITENYVWVGDENDQPIEIDFNSLNTSGIKKLIETTDDLGNPSLYQYWIYDDFTIEGTFTNEGEVVIANGELIIELGGIYVESGVTKFVNFIEGTPSETGYVSAFTLVANIPLNLTHNLNTKDFVWSAREGDNELDIQLTRINDNTISLLSTVGVSGSITIKTI